MQVDDATLDAIPEAENSLTRLVQDSSDNLYWVADGTLWNVDEWRNIVTDEAYLGVPRSGLDTSLRRQLQIRYQFEDGLILRAGVDTYLYYDGQVAQVFVGRDTPMLDVPTAIIDNYEQVDTFDAVSVTLSAGTNAANLRSGPGLDAAVLETITHDESLTAFGRNSDGRWLFVGYGDEKLAWLSAALVADQLALNFLPVSEMTIEARTLPQAEPAAISSEASSTEPSAELQPLTCDTVPIRGFGKVWSENLAVQHTLGCVYYNSSEQSTKAAAQQFQNGTMLWLEADSSYVSGDPVYVFFNDGTYQRFDDLGAADPAKVGETPDGFFPVGDKFSKVYWEGTGAQVKQRLGNATSEAIASDGAFQQFYNGRMFWISEIDRIFVIYDYSVYDDAGNRTDIRTWQSFEDTF